MSYPEAPFLSRTELPIQNTHTTGRSGGPGRRAGGRTTLQTSSNRSDLKPLARTPVTNVVNLRPKTTIFSEKAVGLTAFVTTDRESTQKTPPIDDVCNNTQQKGQKTQRGRLAGGPPPTGTHSGPALRAGQTAAAPDGARNTSGATSTSHTNTRVRQRGGHRSTRPLSAHSATASSRLRPNDRQSWRRLRIHRNMPPTTAAPRPAPPIRPSKPVRARRWARPVLGLVAGTSGAT